jgi:hypothetical protein
MKLSSFFFQRLQGNYIDNIDMQIHQDREAFYLHTGYDTKYSEILKLKASSSSI